MRPSRVLLLCALTALVAALAPTSAMAAPKRTSPSVKLSTKTTMTELGNGVRHYHFVYGPVTISPGQNSIFLRPNQIRPKENGHILSFVPNLIRMDGTIPRVDVTHLHHAVWAVNNYPTWAAGEEKTSFILPKGYGWRYRTTDSWIMNDMIHNLTPTPDRVYITYDMDFVPDTAPQAASITTVRTEFMNVVRGLYPVFDAKRGSGVKTKAGMRFTYPDDDPKAKAGPYALGGSSYTFTKDATLVGTGGHLHPGGLYSRLYITRNGQKKLLFQSDAKYWEPAGAVSWDVSMTVTPDNWRINVNKGDTISINGTYDTTKASWYESMVIMPVSVADGHQGVDPFAASYPTKGKVTHGPLAENRVHGGAPTGLPNPMKALSGPVMTAGRQVFIDGFVYQQGDLSYPGRKGRPPVVRKGQSITFKNLEGGTFPTTPAPDKAQPIYHTITACKTPCTRSTGIAYPLADGKVDFDSGELGYGAPGQTAAANTDTWQTPKGLPTGTYTYFCRVHPFMRGAFRVIKPKA